MGIAGRLAIGLAGMGLVGCGATPGVLAGGSVVWRPSVAAPVLAVPETARGRVLLVGGQRRVEAGDVTLDNRGKIRRTVDDSLRLGLDAAVRVADRVGLRLTMEAWNYGAEGFRSFSGDWFEGTVRLGVRALRLSTVRKDSVRSEWYDILEGDRVETKAEDRLHFAPTGGVTVALLPRSPVRPWMAWATTRLPDPELESSVQPVVSAGGWLHEWSGGLALGGVTGFQAWGGAGMSLCVANGMRSGWNASGGVGLGF